MKQRALELLSSYLDGELDSADSARLETRLRTDPELRSVLQDLRDARSLLRQLPLRKAPRNFTLTPKMVGKNPPLPRYYPIFRFAAMLASILLFFTFGLNILGPQPAAQPAVSTMRGGGVPATYAPAEAVTQAPAATEPPVAASLHAATEAPVEPSLIQMAPMVTATSLAQDATNRVMDTAVAKEPGAESSEGGLAQQPPKPVPQPAEVKAVSPVWQWLLAGIALLSLFIMAIMRQRSVNRWRS